MKQKHFSINSHGKVVQVSDRFCSLVSAANITEATAKLLSFARRALDQRPVLRVMDGATQLSYWTMEGVCVESGFGKRTNLCMAGVERMELVNDETASFSYYAQLSREEAA